MTAPRPGEPAPVPAILAPGLEQRRARWSRDKWWLEKEYARVYRERITPEQVDLAVCEVAKVFSPEWAQGTPNHPVYLCLLSRGLMPLQFLYGLGMNLLEVRDSLRLPSVIADLQDAGNYESTRFEIEIAAHLKRCGHTVEFRPPLPSGRRADFVTGLETQRVYFEIKRLQESLVQLELDYLTQIIASALSDLVSERGHPTLKGKGYRVELDAAVPLLLGSNPEGDRDLIEGIKNQVIAEILERAGAGSSLDFLIPAVARVCMENLPVEGSSVVCPMAPSASELRRIVGGRLQDAIRQLHPEHPGIIVLQTPGGLELDMAQAIVGGLLAQLSSNARHVSGVVIFPVFHPLPGTWAHFRPFAVTNRTAQTDLNLLRAFTDLNPLLSAEVMTPDET